MNNIVVSDINIFDPELGDRENHPTGGTSQNAGLNWGHYLSDGSPNYGEGILFIGERDTGKSTFLPRLLKTIEGIELGDLKDYYFPNQLPTQVARLVAIRETFTVARLGSRLSTIVYLAFSSVGLLDRSLGYVLPVYNISRVVLDPLRAPLKARSTEVAGLSAKGQPIDPVRFLSGPWNRGIRL